MPTERGFYIRTDNITLDRTKLVFHDNIPNNLELTLVDWHSEMIAHLSYLKDTKFGKCPEILGDIRRWDKSKTDHDRIISEYNAMLDVIKNGQYKLHIHWNDKMRS